VDERNYWVRTEQGSTWGPYSLEKLERLRGQLTEKCEASLDGQSWRPGTEFPELRDLLAPARKVEKVAVAPPAPRISPAMAKAFGVKTTPGAVEITSHDDEPAAAPVAPAAAPPAAPAAAPAAAKKPATVPAPPAPPPVADKPLELPESGSLADMSPVRLYALAALTNASGWLQLELEKGRMLQISFRRGTPEHLSTDDPDQSLVRFLLQRGVVPAAQALEAEEQAAKSGQDLVSVLFQMQLIPPADAHRLLGDHAQFLLDRALVCWRGKFSFEKDAPSPPGSFPIGQRWTLLAEAVRRVEVTLLRARLGKRLLRPVQRSGGMGVGKVDELALNAQESRIYASIDGTKTGEEILQAHEASAGVRLLYLLTELGHLAFAETAEEEKPQPPPGPVPATQPPGAAAAPEASRLPKNKERTRELPKTVRDAPARAAAPPVMKSAPPVMHAATSAVKPAAAPLPPPPTYAQTPAGETPEQAIQRLTAVVEKLAKADHFVLLGMERKTASAAEAKRNFFVLAKELHPDTVTDTAQDELRQLKERLFARINEAAQVLSDDKRRKDYEDELEGKKNSVDVARIFAAEENFQRAEILIKAHKYQEGLDLLEKAIEMNDEEAEFYAWRGYARFLVARDRKAVYEEASGDCKKAIKMIDKCLPAHLFLGHMAKVLGEMKLAQQCYQRVLQLDPTHIEAQRELRLMGKKT
jgi:tetratricopeptide (TPR) repeat protein